MIYFIRHGETTANIEELITGVSEVELTSNGIKQALQAKNELGNVNIDICFCSPLKRTLKTCDIVCEDRKIKTIVDNRISARNYGEFEGVKYKDAHGKINWNVLVKEGGVECEPITAMVERVFAFINYIKENYCNKNVLIVAHSSVGKIFNCYFNGFPANGDVFTKKFKNAEVVTFSFPTNWKKSLKKQKNMI